MKVCTDSCILGAFANVTVAQTIIDIGTGTGLLALMAAQRAPLAKIDAVEINAAAAAQAKENIAASPWPDKIKVYHESLQQFSKSCQTRYDVILSNPPFYQDSLRSPNEQKNIAKHTELLGFEDIVAFAQKYLEQEGSLYVLLPPPEAKHFITFATQANFFLQHQLALITKPAGKHFRDILTFSRKPNDAPVQQQLTVQDENSSYTQAFRALLKDYYLYFDK